MKKEVKRILKNKYKYVFVICALAIAQISFASEEIIFADIIFLSKEHIKLRDMSMLTESEYKKYRLVFMQQLKSDEFCHDNMKNAIFRKYDLNGDAVGDIIFSDYCGSEEVRNFIWLQGKDSLQYAGFIEGTPLKLFRDDKSGTTSIAVSKGWCCAGYVGSVTLYNLMKNEQGNLVYLSSKKVMQFGGVTLPKTRMAPVRFLIEKDKYELRRAPEVSDERDAYMSELTGETFYGNILAEFSKGSQGEAIAEHRDKTGAVWWFVVMDTESKTTTNHFYEDENGYKTGWMESKYLKKILEIY